MHLTVVAQVTTVVPTRHGRRPGSGPHRLWSDGRPLTSGLVLALIATDHGPEFASAAAVGALAGLAAIAAFCVGYSLGGRALGVAACLAVASGMFFLAAIALQPVLDGSIWLLLAIVGVAIAGASRLIPSSGEQHGPIPSPRWDLPARMVVATGLVVGLSTYAPLLGPHWSGIIATFPVYLSVLAAFTHHHAGTALASDVLRGLLAGLYGTAAFYVVVNTGLEALGIAVTFAAAVGAALAIEAVTLRRIRPGLEPEPA